MVPRNYRQFKFVDWFGQELLLRSLCLRISIVLRSWIDLCLSDQGVSLERV